MEKGTKAKTRNERKPHAETKERTHNAKTERNRKARTGPRLHVSLKPCDDLIEVYQLMADDKLTDGNTETLLLGPMERNDMEGVAHGIHALKRKRGKEAQKRKGYLERMTDIIRIAGMEA